MRRALVIALAALAVGCGGSPPQPGSTLRATLVDRDGDGFLEPGPGEPLVERGRRARLGRTLATFAQLTDTHVRDEESPARSRSWTGSARRSARRSARTKRSPRRRSTRRSGRSTRSARRRCS